MGDKTSLQKLGDEFCTAVRAKTQSKYKDIEERLDILLKLIKQKKDSTAITTELDRIEKALKDKNEFNPTIRECEKKIRNFWDVNKGKKTGTAEKGNIDPQKQGHGSGKTESKQLRSSQSDTDLSISGKAMTQTQETGNSDVVDNITSFFEQLVWALHDLLKNNIMDESKAKLPSVPAISDKELQNKLKSMYAKVEETTKLCFGKNSAPRRKIAKKRSTVKQKQKKNPFQLKRPKRRDQQKKRQKGPSDSKKEVNQASEFLNDLYKKATHVNEGHVTDQVQSKGSKPPNLSEDTRKNRVQEHSPVPAKHESGEVSKLDERLARILSTWKKMEETKEDVELASRLFADLRKVAKTTSTDIKYDSEGRLNDQSAEKENKGVLGTGKGDATSPSRIDRSQTFQRDFELVKTALIQKKDTQRLMPAVKEEKNQQHHQSADRRKLEEEVKSLRMRLSELAGAKLYKDNPDIADLSDPHRPTKLRESYCEIYSNEWMDAYQKLSESKSKRSEENVIKCLLDILLEGFAYCTHIKALQRDGLQEVILYPARDYGKSQVKKENDETNDIFGRHLAEVLKLSGDMTGEHVAKAFFWKKDMRDKFGSDFEKSEKYITKCVKLCWLMQVQTPPVCIDLLAKPGDKFDNETYKEYTKKGKKIDFIVWPPLRRNEGGLLIEKGVAQGK